MIIEFLLSTFSIDEVYIVAGSAFGIVPDGSKFETMAKNAGIIHMMVMSGANIYFLLSFINCMLFSISQRAKLSINIVVCLILLCAFISQASVVRACLSVIVVIVGKLLGRQTLSLYATTLLLLFFLVVEPDIYKNISFQLSFAAVYGIILFDSQDESKEASGIVQYIKNTAKTSICAQSLTTPIILLHFNTVTLTSIFSNILISWIIAPLTLLTYLHVVISPAFGSNAVIIILLKLICNYVITISSIFGSVGVLNF